MSSFFPGVRPVELIPGDPVELRWLAGRLGVLADGLGETAHDLAAIDAHDWTGPAADAFHQAVKVQPGRYTNAATGFNAASTAVLGYANALEAAQHDAGRAISAHQDADNATAAWQQRQQAAAAQLRADTATTGHPTTNPPSQPSSDPGDQGRNQAGTILQDARLALETAATRLKTTLQDAQHTAPTRTGHSATLLHRAELDGLSATGAAGMLLGGGSEFLDNAKLTAVERATTGSVWVKVGSGSTYVMMHREKLPWQESLSTKAGIGGAVLSGVAGAGLEWFKDRNNPRYPLGEKLARAATAGGVSVGATVATGAAVDGVMGISTVATFMTEGVAIAAIPGLGEIAAVVVVTVVIGILAEKFLAPVVTKEALRAEHWAIHEGAHDVSNFARDDARGYAEEGRAVASVATGGVHLAGEGIHDVSRVATSVGDGAGHAAGSVVHGLGKAKDAAVKDLKSGFGLFG